MRVPFGLENCMKLFGCSHRWEIIQRSNVIQHDSMGYPLRLFVVKCEKCGKYDQHWIDVDVSELRELETGESVLLKWK